MPAPRITRDVAKPKRKKNPRRQPEHRAYIRKLGFCLACATWKPATLECAHIRVGTDGGTGIKPSDRYTIPLCQACHQRQHARGEATFWREAGIDPTPVAERLWLMSGNVDQGLRTLERAWQGRLADVILARGRP